MAGYQVLPHLRHHRPRSPVLVALGQIQSQAMSHAKFIFLIALVIFFVALFVAAYIWMRRPDFGQKGGQPMTTVSGGTVGQVPSCAEQPRSDPDRSHDAPKASDVL